MPKHKITLKTPDETHVISCGEDQTIVDSADEESLYIPYSCRNGSCSVCAGKLIEGSVDQDDQMFLDQYQIDAGYILTCVAKPTSDCTIETDRQADV
jgi:ferredoxin